MNELTIGQAARKAGVQAGTIRFYEQRGLLSPDRTAANYRVYSGEDLRRLEFIRRGQELGFTLEEIRELLELEARPGARCGDVLKRAERKREAIREKIRMLQSMDRALGALIRQCDGTARITECPILECMETTTPVRRERRKRS